MNYKQFKTLDETTREQNYQKFCTFYNLNPDEPGIWTCFLLALDDNNGHITIGSNGNTQTFVDGVPDEVFA